MAYLIEEKIRFGNTDLEIPPIIFGTSSLGNLYVDLSKETKLNIVKECIDNVSPPVVFDTAGKYGAGLALEVLGECLEKLNVDKNDVIISNKLGWYRIPLATLEPTFEPGVWKNIHHDAIQKISYSGILECFRQGNDLLGKYTPSLVSVHDPDEYIGCSIDESDYQKKYKDILDAYKALFELKKEGKVKGVGVGAKDWKTIRRLADEVKFDWVMFANSLTIMRHPPELLRFIDLLYKSNVAIINSAVFHGGFLTGGKFFDYRLLDPNNPEDKKIFKWREEFFDLCKKYEINPSIPCVHFARTVPGVISIALSTSNPERIKENILLVKAEVPDAFYKEMKEKGLIDKNYPYVGT